jgi:hypothetical protein
MASDNKLELVIEVQADRANAQIKAVNQGPAGASGVPATGCSALGSAPASCGGNWLVSLLMSLRYSANLFRNER